MQVAVLVPVELAYKTSSTDAQEPSGRQVSDAQSASTPHAWQRSSTPHTGVVGAHALVSAAVHWTHIPRGISHIGVGFVHCASLVQIPASIPTPPKLEHSP